MFRVFENGVDYPVSKLYPPVDFPVSRGTPMISPLVKWDHSEDWFVTKFESQKSNKSGERHVVINLDDLDHEYVVGHTIDGRVLFPATAYLQLVWETLGLMMGVFFFELEVEFEDIQFLRATAIAKDNDIEFIIMIQPGTGRFEITEGTSAVVTGYIKLVENPKLATVAVPEKNDLPILKTRDFYKELRLRGYHYNGVFKSVVEARSDGLQGKIKWDTNWVSFMDCLLQIHIVGQDSRGLLLPTGIQKLVINPKIHLQMANLLDEENPVFDVYSCPRLNILRSGGIEIRGLQASYVGRRRPPGIPVLEVYKFIPHLPTPMLSKINVARFCVQLALENEPSIKVKSVEIDANNDTEPLSAYFSQALGDLPLVTSEINYLTTKDVNLGNIIVENTPLTAHTKCMFIINTNCLSDARFLESAVSRMDDSGFIISREQNEIKLNLLNQLPTNYQLLAILPTDDETIVMLQYNKKKLAINPKVINVTSDDENYDWVDELSKSMNTGPVLAISEKEKLSGILGLVNCLRKEPNGLNLRCVFVDDPRAPVFDPEHQFYKPQLKLGLAMNVFKNGQWGSYRHFLMNQKAITMSRSDHCYANALTRGDLSSMTWLNGPYNYGKPAGEIVKLKYASLNFRDVMLASGKLTAEVFGSGRLDQQCILGFEYAGVSEKGRRVMGMVISGALVSYINN